MDRDHDVAVGGPVAAVDHRVGHAVVVDQHRALAGRHLDRHAGERGDLARPGAGRGDHEFGPHPRHRAGALVAEGHLGDPAPACLHAHDAVVRERVAAAAAGVPDRGLDQLPRLDGAVRHAERAADLRVERGLPRQEVRHPDLLEVARRSGCSCRRTRRRSRRDRRASRRSSHPCPRRWPGRSAAGPGSPRCTPAPRACPCPRSGRRSGGARGTGPWCRCRSRSARRAGT